MCKCRPEIKAPFCGRSGCEYPIQIANARPDDELERLIYQLENRIERAESPDWCVLHLDVAQGKNLLRLIRERAQAT